MSSKPAEVQNGGGRISHIADLLRVGAPAVYLYSMAWLVLATFVLVLVGLQPMLIGSGSMRPLIRAGDLVLVASAADPAGIAPGTVITYNDGALGGRIVTHRIFDVTADGSYVTKGDANPAPDSDVVAPSDVIGTGRVLIPYVGLPAQWVRQGEWLPLAIWLAITLGALASVTPGRREPPDVGSGTTREGAIARPGRHRKQLSRVAFLPSLPEAVRLMWRPRATTNWWHGCDDGHRIRRGTTPGPRVAATL